VEARKRPEAIDRDVGAPLAESNEPQGNEEGVPVERAGLRVVRNGPDEPQLRAGDAGRAGEEGDSSGTANGGAIRRRLVPELRVLEFLRDVETQVLLGLCREGGKT